MVFFRGKRKALPEHKGRIGYAKKQKENDGDCGIAKLPDDLLIDILSRASLKEAAKTSVLSSRWENLWKSTSGKLEFIYDKDTAACWDEIDRTSFRFRVDSALYLHQGTRIDSLIIRFPYGEKLEEGRSFSVGQWVGFAMLKEAKRFELDLSVGGAFHCDYRFPDLVDLLRRYPWDKWSTLFDKWGSDSRCLRSVGAFCSLRSLRLVDVNIKDEVVRYFLASCHYLEQLCIKASDETINLQVVDPLPNLKELEIADCCNMQSLVISVASLVSCTYGGKEMSSPIFKNNPNLSKLTLSGEFCESFIYEPTRHSSYSAQLVELVLNLESVEQERQLVPPDLPQLYALKRLQLNITSQVNRRLHFFTLLIKASPQLQELKMKMEYLVPCTRGWGVTDRMPFPEVTAAVAEANGFHHENLKVVSMAGYYGCASEDEFLVQLCHIAPSLETVSIDTDCNYYLDDPKLKHILAIYKLRRDGIVLMKDRITNRRTPSRARKHARRLQSTFPSKINFLIP